MRTLTRSGLILTPFQFAAVGDHRAAICQHLNSSAERWRDKNAERADALQAAARLLNVLDETEYADLLTRLGESIQ